MSARVFLCAAVVLLDPTGPGALPFPVAGLVQGLFPPDTLTGEPVPQVLVEGKPGAAAEVLAFSLSRSAAAS